MSEADFCIDEGQYYADQAMKVREKQEHTGWLYQVDYRVPGYFYTLTAYDLVSSDEDDIRNEIAQMEGCDPDDLAVDWYTLKRYRG